MSSDDLFEGFSGPAQMQHVMVDIETASTKPNAAIVAIGAVTFDMKSLTLGERFYTTVSLESCQSLGLVIDASTVVWWMQQSEQARRQTFGGDQLNLPVALQKFSAWLDEHMVELKGRWVWGNSPSFDCIMLSEHYHKAGMEVPWHFSNERDFRTFRNLWPNVELDQGQGTHHNALDDAEYQVNHMFKIRRALRANT